MNTHTRRFVVTVLLIGGVAIATPFTLSALSASKHQTSGSTVAFYGYHHGPQLLGAAAVANGSGIKLVWPARTCASGYASPPVMFDWWSYTTVRNDQVRPTPQLCTKAGVAPNGVFCTFTAAAPYLARQWTWKSGILAPIPQPDYDPGGTVWENATIWLYGRPVQSATIVTKGKPTVTIKVPTGTVRLDFIYGGLG